MLVNGKQQCLCWQLPNIMFLYNLLFYTWPRVFSRQSYYCTQQVHTYRIPMSGHCASTKSYTCVTLWGIDVMNIRRLNVLMCVI